VKTSKQISVQESMSTHFKMINCSSKGEILEPFFN